MKFKSQKSAILYALISGKWLSAMDSFINFGCTKISTRIGEYEKEFNFLADKKFVDFTTKYGTPGNYKKYHFDKNKYPEAYEAIRNYLVLQGETIAEYANNMKKIPRGTQSAINFQ